MARSRRPCLLALLFLTILGLGCAKRSGGKDAAYAEEAMGFPAGNSVGADMAGPAPVMGAEEAEVTRTLSSRGGRSRARYKKSAQKNRRDAPMATEAGASADDDWGGEAAPEPEPVADKLEPVESPSEQPVSSSKRRQVIYTATMGVSVYDLPAALAFAEAIPTRYGGWLQQRVDNRFVLRVPAEQLEAVMDAIAELGVVDARTLTALDVTAEYTDLESRIRVLEQMQAQLQTLLDQAKTVEQALEIRKVLDGITLELEAARAQMRSLAQSIAFSTLVLSLRERGPTEDVPSSNDPFSWVDRLGAEATEFR